MHSAKLQNLAVRLFQINALKFGSFTIKSGINSPIYFDLRVIISYPDVMELLCDLLLEFIKENYIPFDHICGVPYTALPVATLLTVKDKKPMLMRRKESKAYGTKKLIEGVFNVGEKCLIVEDVVTSGSSVLETVQDLRAEGIIVTDAIVIVDREQGGAVHLKNKNVQIHSLFTLSALLKILNNTGYIDESTVQKVEKYIESSQIKSVSTEIVNDLDRTKMTYEQRANFTKCKVAKDLLNIMSIKKSNLCLAADLTYCKEILSIADICGPYICVFKTHVDIIEDFDINFINSLSALATKHNFFIMEDRKFADIGNTVALQYSKGVFNISKWAHLVTAHSLPGESIIKGLKSVLTNYENRGVFLLAELSSSGSLISQQYTEDTVKLATSSCDMNFVAGLVAQNKCFISSPGLIQLTPGVQINNKNDELGQQYNTPEYVVKEKGADIAVVGRGIFNAENIENAAKLYRDRLWAAYCYRVGI